MALPSGDTQKALLAEVEKNIRSYQSALDLIETKKVEITNKIKGLESIKNDIEVEQEYRALKANPKESLKQVFKNSNDTTQETQINIIRNLIEKNVVGDFHASDIIDLNLKQGLNLRPATISGTLGKLRKRGEIRVVKKQPGNIGHIYRKKH